MNIVSERDGLEMVNENGRWVLYIVESDGRHYHALGEMYGYEEMGTLSEYIATSGKGSRQRKHPDNDNRDQVADKAVREFLASTAYLDEVPF